MNIIIRALMYLVKSYHEYFERRNDNLYSSKKARLPKAELYVIFTEKRVGKPECNKEMDAEALQLGPGSEPSDCPVWGASHGITIKKTGMAASETSAIPALFHRHLYDCQKIPVLFQRPDASSAHGNGNNIQCLFTIQ